MARKRPSDDCANIENKRSKASTSRECDNEGAKNSTLRKEKRNVVTFVSDDSSQTNSDSENPSVVSQVRQTNYAKKKRKNKCKIIPPKNVFKNISKVPKGQRRPPPPKKKKPGKKHDKSKKDMYDSSIEIPMGESYISVSIKVLKNC